MLQWASRIVGLPSCNRYGLRHRPASVYLAVNSITGAPALPGFPCKEHRASGIDWLPCETCERCFVGTCRYCHYEISSRRLRFMAPERGPLLGSTFDPPIYVPPTVGGHRLGGHFLAGKWHPNRGPAFGGSKTGSVSWSRPMNTRPCM